MATKAQKTTILSQKERLDVGKIARARGPGQSSPASSSADILHYLRSEKGGTYLDLIDIDPKYASSFEGDIVEVVNQKLNDGSYITVATLTTPEEWNLYGAQAVTTQKEKELLKNLYVSGEAGKSFGLGSKRPARQTSFSRAENPILKEVLNVSTTQSGLRKDVKDA